VSASEAQAAVQSEEDSLSPEQKQALQQLQAQQKQKQKETEQSNGCAPLAGAGSLELSSLRGSLWLKPPLSILQPFSSDGSSPHSRKLLQGPKTQAQLNQIADLNAVDGAPCDPRNILWSPAHVSAFRRRQAVSLRLMDEHGPERQGVRL
jgi:hypothetical protein